jgi:hypothetical protein
MLPGFALASVRATTAKSQLQCMDTTKLSFTALNGNGQPLGLCSGTTLSASASIQARGPYAYLRLGTQEGPTLNFSMTSASSSFVVVLDTTKGFIPQGFDVATVHVTVEGVTKDTTVNLSCPYPLPSVSILRPRDTTIVLTALNQPTITFQETHSPTSGKFAPSITWTPGQTINTTDYFSQIQDSLVLMVRVKAQNVAADTAVDSTTITLKKQTCALVQFAKQELSPGDTTLLTFKKVLDGGALGDFPSGQLFDVVLENASGSGFLLSSTGTTGATLIGVPAPVYYVAPDSLTGDSLVVNVHAVTSAQTSSSVRRTSNGRATISLKKAGLGRDSEPTTDQPSAYELQLYTKIAEACPAPATVIVKEALLLTMAINNALVSPKGTSGSDRTDIVVTVTRNGIPVSNAPITLMIQPVPYGGGHDHDDSSKPKGTLQNSEGTTDPEGNYRTTYISSEVSGTELLTANSGHTSTKAVGFVEVKVPELQDFGLISSNFWQLTGNSGPTTYQGCPGTIIQHGSNHFASEFTMKQLQLALWDFFQWSGDEEVGFGTYLKLYINDMSLSGGGLFDICSKWQEGHTNHRTGASVDINGGAQNFEHPNNPFIDLKTTMVGNRTLLDRLTEIMQKHDGSKFNEEPIHYGFGGR